jgi:GNAT superfamily N-acetyltransferase
VTNTNIRPATADDVPLILSFIRALAVYERLEHLVVATEEGLRATLFGNPRFAEVLIASEGDEPAGFALFFHNYSTFLGCPGIYLEDLFVKPEMRGRGFGKALLVRLAQIARERGCGRFEWCVLDWNEKAQGFYQSLGAKHLAGWQVYRMEGDAIAALAGAAIRGC